MKEHELGHGVIRRNPLVKKLQKIFHRANGQRIGKSTVPFEWEKGFDVRDTVGQVKIKDQGSNNSCGRQAGSYFQFIERKLRGIDEGEISAKSGYGKYCARGGGMTITSLVTDIGAYGANLEATVPSYDAYGNPLPEYMMVDESWETHTTLSDAMTRAGYTFYDIAEDIETVATTLKNYGAVFMEIRGNNNNSWLSHTPSINKVGKYWYHYMIIVGAKLINGQKKLIALNSWGEDCGLKGEQCFGDEWFTSGNIIDVFTFIHDSLVVVKPDNTSVWAEVTRFFQRLWNSQVKSMAKLSPIT